MNRPARLYTSFGTQLYIDAASGELRHGSAGSVPDNAVLVSGDGSTQVHRIAALMHDGGGTPKPIACGFDRCDVQDAGAGAHGTAVSLDVVALERGMLGLTANGRFLMADPNGLVRLCAPACSTWEFFLASEEWCAREAVGDAWARPDWHGLAIDRPALQRCIVHPSHRRRSGIRTAAPKVLIYGYTKWSHGRVYSDLCRLLHRRGYIVDLLDWQVEHHEHMPDLKSYYDWFMVSLTGVKGLSDFYGVPYERMIALCHSELDIRTLIEQRTRAVFDRFAGYGVVSDFLYHSSLMQGVTRLPTVVPLGVNFDEFEAEPPTRLATVGYSGSYAMTMYGQDLKRGHLAAQAARDAGLEFVVAGSTADQISFHDMPDFYRTVDAVLLSSISEGASLPVIEAAAAGRLVIGTAVGHFAEKACAGGGILAPMEEERYVSFCTDTLQRYSADPAAFNAKCRAIQEAARAFDWRHHMGAWTDLISQAGRSGAGLGLPPGAVDARDDANAPLAYDFAVDWFSQHIPVWDSLLGQLKPRRIVEVGSFEGRSACHIVERCSQWQPIELVCIDTWEGGFEHDPRAMGEVERRFDHNVRVATAKAAHPVSLRKIKKPSSLALAELVALGDAPFDLIYIDGSHRAADVLVDAALAFQVLRVGGIMIFDDYLWSNEPKGQEDAFNMPKPAIDSFVNLYTRQIEIILGLPISQLYLRRRS